MGGEVTPIRDNEALDPGHKAVEQTKQVKGVSGAQLSLRNMMFINYLLQPSVMLDAEKAYRLAGYEGNAKRGSYKLMQNPEIRQEVEVRMHRMSLAAELSPDNVLQRLWEEQNNHTPEDSSPTARVAAGKVLAQHFDLIGPSDRGRKQPIININMDMRNNPESEEIASQVMDKITGKVVDVDPSE